MNNFISLVNNFNLVIYTDDYSSQYIDINNNKNIKIIIKPKEEFYMYKFKNFWIKNHEKNHLLNNQSIHNTCWELNMLWSEKIWFVSETKTNKYFETPFYGWCDIGYFRDTDMDLSIDNLKKWPSDKKIAQLDKTKIYYGCINNNNIYLYYLQRLILDKNHFDLPKNPIPPHQQSVSGGFFIIYKDMIEWWSIVYTQKLKTYFENEYLVKDDQIIIIDCIYNNPSKFQLLRELETNFDNWFMFQRILI
jgi:hypothetical protein